MSEPQSAIGWLPVVDGPRDGHDFYPPLPPKPGQRYYLGTRAEQDGDGYYAVAWLGEIARPRVVLCWFEVDAQGIPK